MATHSSSLAWTIPSTGACWATVHGVAKNWTRLSDFHSNRRNTAIGQTMWTIIGETIKMYPLFISIFWLCHVACGILVPWQGLNPHSLHSQHSLNCWTTREVTTAENLIKSAHWHGRHMALHFERLRLSLVWLTSEAETTTALDTADGRTGHMGQPPWLGHPTFSKSVSHVALVICSVPNLRGCKVNRTWRPGHTWKGRRALDRYEPEKMWGVFADLSLSYYWLTHSVLFWRRECSSPGLETI